MIRNYFKNATRLRPARSGYVIRQGLIVLALSSFSAVPMFAAAGPISGWTGGIKSELVAAAQDLAIIGILIAAAMLLFGAERFGDIAPRIFIGAIILGGAATLASWLFGL